MKRLWGYVTDNSSPRLSTLNLLAQYIDYKDWNDFCQREGIVTTLVADEADGSEEAQPDTAAAAKTKPPQRRTTIVAIAVVVAVVVATLIANRRQMAVHTAGSQHYVIRKGQVFPTVGDYLQLFGINDSATYWGRVLPHHPSILIWGPEYHYPHWLNEGDRQLLMPTITEQWRSEQADSQWIAMRNADKFSHERRTNEVRITFMKNLTDTGYIFLGIYRLSLAQSDSTRCVWERVAEECDLANLGYLEELRN